MAETPEPSRTEFEKLADAEAPSSLLGEFRAYLSSTKKWWLTPIILTLLFFGTLMILSATSAGPFVYSFF